MHASNTAVQNVAVLGLVISLLALAVSWFYSAHQLKEATKQAGSSDEQAKAAQQMAQLSLSQTEIMRAQLHAAFRPLVEVVGGEYETQSAMLTVKNVGTSPALALHAVFRNGWRESLGSLAPDSIRRFRFDYNFNLPPPPPVGPPDSRDQSESVIQPVPLRLEYTSVSGAKCWTDVEFTLGAEPPFEFQQRHGMDLPSLPVKS